MKRYRGPGQREYGPLYFVPCPCPSSMSLLPSLWIVRRRGTTEIMNYPGLKDTQNRNSSAASCVMCHSLYVARVTAGSVVIFHNILVKVFLLSALLEIVPSW